MQHAHARMLPFFPSYVRTAEQVQSPTTQTDAVTMDAQLLPPSAIAERVMWLPRDAIFTVHSHLHPHVAVVNRGQPAACQPASPGTGPICSTTRKGPASRCDDRPYTRVSQYQYYKTPTLRHSPTSRIRGLNLKGPGGRPRGRGKWRPQENKTQPTATASTGGKKVICGRNAQKYQKCSVGKCPSGAEETAIQVVYAVIISL